MAYYYGMNKIVDKTEQPTINLLSARRETFWQKLWRMLDIDLLVMRC